MTKSSRVALVLPYYGVLPPYFNFYLRSLAGKNLDVLFFSDLKVEKHPENFKPIQMTFDAFKRLAFGKLGVTVRLDSPKRLCDFKPMYGKVFEDYLKGYDYWAFGDCDLVYGNSFNEILQEALEGGYDVFSLHRCYCSGPFCILKNCENVCTLYLNADNLEEVCSAPGTQCVAFDELHGDWHGQLEAGTMTIEECRRRGDSFSAVAFRTPGLKVSFREIIEERSLCCGEIVRMTNDGRLTIDEHEIPLYHYVCAKIRKFFTFVRLDYERITDYAIDDTGFYVSRWQKNFRLMINFARKFKAAWRSVLRNGFGRIFKGWSRAAGYV